MNCRESGEWNTWQPPNLVIRPHTELAYKVVHERLFPREQDRKRFVQSDFLSECVCVGACVWDCVTEKMSERLHLRKWTVAILGERCLGGFYFLHYICLLWGIFFFFGCCSLWIYSFMIRKKQSHPISNDSSVTTVLSCRHVHPL